VVFSKEGFARRSSHTNRGGPIGYSCACARQLYLESTPHILAHAENSRLQKAVEGLISGSYTISIAR
jgi:hypothetical protein